MFRQRDVGFQMFTKLPKNQNQVPSESPFGRMLPFPTSFRCRCVATSRRGQREHTKKTSHETAPSSNRINAHGISDYCVGTSPGTFGEIYEQMIKNQKQKKKQEKDVPVRPHVQRPGVPRRVRVGFLCVAAVGAFRTYNGRASPRTIRDVPVPEKRKRELFRFRFRHRLAAAVHAQRKRPVPPARHPQKLHLVGKVSYHEIGFPEPGDDGRLCVVSGVR